MPSLISLNCVWYDLMEQPLPYPEAPYVERAMLGEDRLWYSIQVEPTGRIEVRRLPNSEGYAGNLPPSERPQWFIVN